MGTHVADSGGARPGTHFLAVDHIAEGLNIPLIKVMEGGYGREDVAELILANNRLPRMMRHEMSSFMGSTAVAEKRMIELLDRYGKEDVYASIEAMVERTESAVRKRSKSGKKGRGMQRCRQMMTARPWESLSPFVAGSPSRMEKRPSISRIRMKSQVEI